MYYGLVYLCDGPFAQNDTVKESIFAKQNKTTQIYWLALVNEVGDPVMKGN